jgi:hypothetical protein
MTPDDQHAGSDQVTRRRTMRACTRPFGPVQSVPAGAAVTIRYAHPEEADALAALAELDSSHAPSGVVIVAAVQGTLWAAVSLDDGHVIADPFRPSGELAFLLVERARQLRRVACGDTSVRPFRWFWQPVGGRDRAL